MARRIGFTLVLSLAALSVTAGDARAQEVGQRLSPFRVLVPDLEPLDGADRGFGRDVADRLRDLFDALVTHEAISRREIDRSLDDFDRDMDEVDCVLARQLAARLDAHVALCAAYEEVGDDRFALTATFHDVGSGEAFAVDPIRRGGRQEEAAARDIFDHFETYTRHLRATAYCEEYAASRLWEDALRNCDDALTLNVEATGARYRRARILFETERLEESLTDLELVLEGDPVHEDGLQLAGYVAARLGRQEEAHRYYTRYLELAPGNAFVRMRVAYELASAGDPPGALRLIREGLDADPDNPDLWEQLGGYAFAIGERINREAASEDGGSVAPDAIPYFREAIDAYERVFAAKGSDTDPAHVRSVVIARLRLGETIQAIEAAQAGLEAYSADAQLWSVYADALRRDGRLDSALEALDRVEAIDARYPNLGLRRGTWLVEDGRIAEAIVVLREVAERMPERADAAARLVFSHAYERGVQRDRYALAIEVIVLAKTLPGLSEPTLHELNFWHGYSVLRAAAEEQESRTLETARATLPRFEEALELLRDVGEYPAGVNVNVEALRRNVSVYIEIQQAIIRRGG